MIPHVVSDFSLFNLCTPNAVRRFSEVATGSHPAQYSDGTGGRGLGTTGRIPQETRPLPRYKVISRWWTYSVKYSSMSVYILLCILVYFPLASGRTNTDLRGMDLGLTTASFGTKAQTAISSKNAEYRRDASSAGDDVTVTHTCGGKHTVVTKRTTTAVTKPYGSKSSRETTPTRTMGTAVRSEPLKHTLVKHASPKHKAGSPSRSRTPGRAISPIGETRKSEPRASASATSSE